METIAESGGIIPHHHHPIAGSSYFPPKDSSSSYFFPNAPNPQSVYHGYNQGEADIRGMIYGQHKGLERRGGGGVGGDGEDRRGAGRGRGGGGGMSVQTPGAPNVGSSGDRYYLPSSQSSHMVQQHPMTPYHHQQSPHRGMSQFLSPQRLDEDKSNGNKMVDSAKDNTRFDQQSLSPEKRLGKDSSSSSSSMMSEFTPKKNGHSFENAMMNSPYYYNNSKQGRQSGFLSDSRHQSYADSAVYPDMIRDSVKEVYESFTHGRNKEEAGKAEAIPVAYDENEMQSQQANSQHFREKLERSTSQDAVAARKNMMNCHDYLYESGDHRPRAITMNSMYNRRDGPSTIQTSPYGHKNHDLYTKMRDHYNQSAMSNPYFYRDKEKEVGGIPPMSPTSFMAKHHRRPSGGEVRTPSRQESSRQESMNRMMMVPPDKFHQPELRPSFPQMNQSQPRQPLQQPEQDQLLPGSSQHRSNMMNPQPSARKSMDSMSEKYSPLKSPTGSEPTPTTTRSPFGPNTRKSPIVSPSDDARSSHELNETDTINRSWTPSNIASGMSPKFSDKQSTLPEEDASSKTPKFPEKPSQAQDSIRITSSPKEDSPDDNDMQSYPCNDGDGSTTPSKLGSSSYHSPKGDDSPSATPLRKISSDSPDDSLPDALPRELMPKKELLSDEGEDDSFHSSSGNYPPMSPSSPNSSSGGINYPHFQQPFFSSPERIPQPHPFGSPRGLQDGGPGMPPAFPFNKDMAGRFPMPGLGRDMALGPRAPFMGQMPLSMGLDKDVYFCHLCSYSGKSKTDFDHHMSIHFEYNCPHCDYTSRTEGRLKRHIKDFHTDENGRRSMPGRPKVFKCKQCSFSATEKDKFWEHARSHIKEDKLLQCPKCPFVTEYKHHLEYHLRNHFGSKPFKCNKCNYSCVNKSMLNSHMKSHTNVYQYRCSDCTYATKYCHSLKLHLRKYNHKPATVLNQDGSLPQGIDADSSGLSVNTKRGPPRGPRGPRKDKNDPFFGQMFGMPPMPPMGMPPGMNPMLKGMMPFWPVMPPSGLHPGHPGMMPVLPNMPPHMGIRGDNGMDMRDRQGMDRGDHEMNGMSGEDSPIKEDDDPLYLPCRLCDFIGDSTEALCLHLLQVHKDETGEMASMYGISESALAESMERAKKTKLERAEQRMERRMSEMSNESENEMSDYRRRNTIAGLLSRESSDFPRGNNTDKPFWSSPFGQGDKTGVDGRIHDLCYVDEGNDDGDNEHDTSGGMGMDILQQMTLKFGGALPTKRSKSLDTELIRDEEGDEVNRDVRNEDKLGGQKKHQSHKESPLDLTKHKSVSPPMFSNPSSPRRMDEFNSEEDDNLRPMWMEPGRGSELDKVTESLARKRQISEMEDNLSATPGNNNNQDGNNSSRDPSGIVPRKRSRKGKAYKLETLCLKLQERRSRSPNDSDDADSDTEIIADNIQPLQTKARNEDGEEKQNIDDVVMEVEEKTNDIFAEEENNVVEEDEAGDDKKDESTVGDEKDERLDNKHDDNMKVGDVKKEVIVEDDKENDNIGNDDDVNGSTSEIKMEPVSDEKDVECEKDNGVGDIKKEVTEQEESENAFEELQETLNDFNKEISEKKEDRQNESKTSGGDEENRSVDMGTVENYDRASFDDNNDDVNNDACDADDDDDDDAKTEILGEDDMCREELDLSDKEISSDGFSSLRVPPEDLSTKPSDEVQIEENVDMINTVIENRRKPLPPAVRRGTELAWKLLNDPVNPVTSIPIPVVSPPPPEWKSQQPKSPMSGPPSASITSPSGSSMAAMSPLKNGIRMGMGFNQGLPPPQVKPHLPIALPPTPMAFIPPTNRMMSEHVMPRPHHPHHPHPHPPSLAPIGKPLPKDLYECTYCDLSFRDCVMYTVHMGYHSNRNPFKCNSCGIICRDKVEFFLHIARSPHS